MASVVRPTWAIVTGPFPVAAPVSRAIARFFLGSRVTGAPSSDSGVTVRRPSRNTTSNLMLSGRARPSEVPRRRLSFPRDATVVTVALPRAGAVRTASGPCPFRATSDIAPVRVRTNATSRYSSTPTESPPAGAAAFADGELAGGDADRALERG